MLNAIFERIAGESPYKSPTDMGVNMAGNCIIEDDVCRRASEQEIIRRYYHALCDQKQGRVDEAAVYKVELLMNQAGVSTHDRAVASSRSPARRRQDCLPPRSSCRTDASSPAKLPRCSAHPPLCCSTR